jgi:hypothetical protein
MPDVFQVGPTGRPLPYGVGVQVYRDAVPGKTQQARWAACETACRRFARHGVEWVAWHGFSTELDTERFKPLAEIARGCGLTPWAAYGIDSTDMAGKGRRIGEVAQMPECAGVIIDGEGKLEDEPPRIEMTRAKELRVSLRAAAPDASVIVQTWELPQKHAGMPYEELAELADCIAPMEYLNNWRQTYGARRAAMMEPRWREGRAWLAARIAPRVRPFFRTTHAVGWDDIPASRDAMLREHETLLVWSEPWPDTAFLAAIKRAVGDRAAAAGAKDRTREAPK